MFGCQPKVAMLTYLLVLLPSTPDVQPFPRSQSHKRMSDLYPSTLVPSFNAMVSLSYEYLPCLLSQISMVLMSLML